MYFFWFCCLVTISNIATSNPQSLNFKNVCNVFNSVFNSKFCSCHVDEENDKTSFSCQVKKNTKLNIKFSKDEFFEFKCEDEIKHKDFLMKLFIEENYKVSNCYRAFVHLMNQKQLNYQLLKLKDDQSSFT